MGTGAKTRVCVEDTRNLYCVHVLKMQRRCCQVYSLGSSSQPAAGNFHLSLCPDIDLVSQDWMTAGMLGARRRTDHVLKPKSFSYPFYGYFYLTDVCVKITTALFLILQNLSKFCNCSVSALLPSTC